MKQRYVYVLATLLTVVGLSIFLYNWQVLGFPLSADKQKPFCTIEAEVHFDSSPGSIKVQLHEQTLTPGYRILNEHSVSHGYSLNLNYGS